MHTNCCSFYQPERAEVWVILGFPLGGNGTNQISGNSNVRLKPNNLAITYTLVRLRVRNFVIKDPAAVAIVLLYK